MDIGSRDHRRLHDAEGAVDDIKSAMLSKIVLMAGKDANRATPRDWYIAAALTLRDRIVNHWLQSNHARTPAATSASTTCRSNS